MCDVKRSVERHDLNDPVPIPLQSGRRMPEAIRPSTWSCDHATITSHLPAHLCPRALSRRSCRVSSTEFGGRAGQYANRGRVRCAGITGWRPTPPDASPEAMEEMEMPDSTPAADETTGAEKEPQAPEGVAADEAQAASVVAAAETFVACFNAESYLDVAALMSEWFLVNYAEISNPYDIPAELGDATAIEIVSIGNALAYDDGRVSVDLVFSGFFYGPGGLGSERWFFVIEDGHAKLDNITPAAAPAGTLPGAIEIDVEMIDYAFVLSQGSVPAGVPVIFHVSNTSFTNSGHVAILVTCQEITPEQLITGERDGEEECGGFFGALYLEPGQTSDFLFTSLEAGTYIFACDVPTASGIEHVELGMVAEFVVE